MYGMRRLMKLLVVIITVYVPLSALVYIFSIQPIVIISNNDTQFLNSHWLHSSDPVLKDNHMNNTVIIYARYRAGSTFISEFFNRNKQFFYLFEPFNTLDKRPEILGGKSKLEHWLKCDFKLSSMKPHRYWIEKMFCMPNAKKGICIPGKQVNISEAETICKKSLKVVVKIIRVADLSYFDDFMRKGAQVVHLVRDPRGLLGSWIKIDKYGDEGQIKEDIKSAAGIYCIEQLKDYHYAKHFLSKNRTDRYKLVRYEDAAKNPRLFMNDIYKFMRMKPDENLMNWVSFQKNPLKDGRMPKLGLYSTDKLDSKAVPYKWRTKLTEETVGDIQDVCSEMMKVYGYKILTPNDRNVSNRELLLPISL